MPCQRAATSSSACAAQILARPQHTRTLTATTASCAADLLYVARARPRSPLRPIAHPRIVSSSISAAGMAGIAGGTAGKRDRAAGAILGVLVGDALGLGPHWCVRHVHTYVCPEAVAPWLVFSSTKTGG